MAARKPKAPVNEVRGLKFEVNDEFMASWAAFKMLRQFNEDELSDFDKLDLSMKLISLATGLTEDDIVAAAGGELAKATDVVELAMEIITTIAPKNS